ncbi:MAG: SGNH/GDSL hydrolase family protein [Myxococcales bacterium]|nr:SGNH/GDSL hydrolase family protein [Myxococcales bacterium]
MQRADAPEALPDALQTLRKLLLGAFILFAVAVGAVALRDWASGASRGLPYLRLGAAASAVLLLLASTWLGHSRQLALLMSATACGAVALTFEAGLWWVERVPDACAGFDYVWKTERCKAAVEAGKPFDGRTTLAALDDLRRSDPSLQLTVPSMSIYQHHPEIAERLLPLGGVPEQSTIFCNEVGVWQVRRTDEHGFFNPPGLYTPGATQVALFGDSYVAGFCVDEDDSAQAVLRRAGVEAIGIGANGNGPLGVLASVREYLPALKSPDVYWLFYEGNDMLNLQVEAASPLARYLEPDYTQHLVARRDEAAQVVSDLFHRYEAEARRRLATGEHVSPTAAAWGAGYTPPTALGTLSSILQLERLRERWERLRRGPDVAEQTYDGALLGRIMARMKADVEAEGSELTFVYLPTWYRYGNPAVPLAPRDEILALAREHGLRVLDFSRVLDESPDPLAYYPYGLFAHFNARGYARLAEEVQADLRTRGHLSAVPSP